MRTSPPHTGTSSPRHRRIPLAAAALTLLAAAAAGCGGTSSSGPAPSAGTPTSGTPTASATSPPAPGTTPTGGAPATTGGPAPAPSTASAPPTTPTSTSPGPGARPASARCTVTDLRMRLGRGDPGAGNIYYPLTFTNISGHACTLDGFPGVSLLRGDGSVIGKPADREGPKGADVRLAPGQSAQADLHTLNRGVKDGGCWREPTLLMAYPPGSTDAMTLATSSPLVCGGTFDVGTVH